jgi:hypothetical protein
VLDTYDTVADPTQHRRIIHNNLTSHKLAEVFKAVRLRQHRVVCWPLYQPQDGPVEFTINQVCRRLEKRWLDVDDLQSMRAVLENIIDNEINVMEETFVMCGYVWN